MNKLTKSIISLILCLCIFASTAVVGFAAVSVNKVTGLEVTSFTASKIDIKWKKDSDARGYEVYRQEGSSGDWERLKRITNNSTVTYSDSDVDPGKLYSYRVRAYKVSGLSRVYGSYSSTVKVATKPENVTSLKATATGSSAITLTWKAAAGAEKYAVYMYNAETKKYDRLTTTTATSYDVTGLSATTKYYFRVRAYHTLNGTITSDYAKISITTPIGDVKNFRLKTSTDNSYSLAWSKTKNVEGYEIYKYDSRSQEWNLFRTTKATSYYFKGVAKNYNVFYKIRSYVTSGSKKVYGVFSDPIAAGTIPAAPKSLVAARNTTNGISLAWEEIVGVEGYEIFRHEVLDNTWEKVDESEKSYFTDAAVPGTSVYKYRVRAYKGSGDTLFYSEFSDVTTLVFQVQEDQDSIYTENLEAIGLVGYLYDPQNQCFYTSDDPWQRNFGYNEVYDFAAGAVLMIIDTLRIKFPYADKDWMIQVWKGQYGLVLIGAEVGVYNKPKDRTLEHYDCAEDEDLLRMSMEMQRLETVNGKSQWNRVLYRPYGEYWWITGFVFGNELGNFDNLRVNIRITMKDYEMLAGVTKSLAQQGYYYETKGLDVYFTFR